MSRGVCISQSGVSAHCDPVLKVCFIEGLVVINGRVEQSTESKFLTLKTQIFCL